MTSQAFLTVAVSSGLGNHESLLTPPQISMALEWAWIAQCLLIQSIGFGKYAVIAFILRIQDRSHTRKATFIAYFLYFIGVSNFFINITEMTMVLTSCSPPSKFWNSAVRGTCNHIVRTDHVGYFQGCMKIFSISKSVILILYRSLGCPQ